jgi:hypothetical protein
MGALLGEERAATIFDGWATSASVLVVATGFWCGGGTPL